METASLPCHRCRENIPHNRALNKKYLILEASKSNLVNPQKNPQLVNPQHIKRLPPSCMIYLYIVRQSISHLYDIHYSPPDVVYEALAASLVSSLYKKTGNIFYAYERRIERAQCTYRLVSSRPQEEPFSRSGTASWKKRLGLEKTSQPSACSWVL